MYTGLKIFLLFVLSLFIISIQTCEKNLVTNGDNFFLVTPNKGVIGTKLKIFDNIPSDIAAESVAIIFSGLNDWIRPDSIRSDTIYTYTPFGAQSGNIELYFSDDSIFVENFNVNEDSPDSVKIEWSNLNYKIDDHIATFTRMPVVSEYNWSVEILEDTVKIKAGFHPGDYSVYYRLNLLNNQKNQLPEFLAGNGLVETDYGEEIKYPLEQGIIKIQDWNIDSVICGRVFSIPGNNNNYTFWYKFDE
ncbi:MAG: hypothetical protein K9L56_15570 [Clostridiales bacterium]|nr:hypothetical protein [Clostridiales bacterium]